MAYSGKLTLDVVSYNVLCSHLCKEEDLPRCDPNALHPASRRLRLRSKLVHHMQNDRILCLQELSRSWYANMLPYFTGHGYTVVPGLYGNAHNGYMGVAVAYPTARYTLLAAATSRVADGAAWPRREKPVSASAAVYVASRAWDWLSSWATWGWGGDAAKKPAPVEDEVERARSRQNVLVLLHMRCLRSGDEFVVGTYHMPCAFDWPDQMRLHAAAVVNHSLAFAEREDAEGVMYPLVLAGDFNFKPGSDCYRIVTEGRLTDEEENDTLSRCPGLDAAKHLRTPTPLKSAYVTARGEEPAFTIHSYAEWSGKPNAFTGTLDYIFHSGHFDEVAADALPDSPDVFATPLPTEEEPSDHLLIRAHLTADCDK